MIKKRLMALILVGGMITSLGTGLTTMAASKTNGTKVKTATQQTQKATPEDKHMDMKTQLDALVAAGTLTQATETKILAYLDSQEAARKAEMTKIKAMTAAERKTYMDSQSKKQHNDLFTSLVSTNTLTQAEATTLETALDQTRTAEMQKSLKTKLDPLVTNGTLTQATEDKVIAYMNQQQTVRQAEKKKLDAMTDAERKTYLDAQKNTAKPDPLADLLKNGTLTQAQVDAIKKLSPIPDGNFEHGKKGPDGGHRH